MGGRDQNTPCSKNDTAKQHGPRSELESGRVTSIVTRTCALTMDRTEGTAEIAVVAPSGRI